MTRTAWWLLALLVATNVAWFLHDDAGEPETPLFDEDAEALEREVSQLKAQLAEHERTIPVLEAQGAPEPADEPANGEASNDERAKRAAAAQRAAVEKDRAAQKAYEEAAQQATAMLRKVMQVEDPALREEGLAELADALTSTNTRLVEYALSALHSLRDVDVDKSRFIALVRDQLDSEHGGIRRSALYAMAAVDPEGFDRTRLLRSAEDSDARVRGHTARLLALTGNKTFEGEDARVVLGLLDDENAHVRKGTIRGLDGATITPALEAKLIEMATSSSERGDAIYFGLSKLPNKSRAVVDALLTHLEDDDHNIRGRAHWGLQRNIAEGQQLYVAQQYAKRLGKFVNPRSHREALKLIVRYGDSSLAPDLQRFAENELVDPDVRKLAAKAASYLDAKER